MCGNIGLFLALTMNVVGPEYLSVIGGFTLIAFRIIILTRNRPHGYLYSMWQVAILQATFTLALCVAALSKAETSKDPNALRMSSNVNKPT